MTDEVPWTNRRDQPQYSNDVVPMCFFQLQTIDDEDDPQETEHKTLKSKKPFSYESQFESNDFDDNNDMHTKL